MVLVFICIPEEGFMPPLRLAFSFFCLSVERSQGIVLLDMSSLCLFFLFFLFSLGVFRHEGLRAVY